MQPSFSRRTQMFRKRIGLPWSWRLIGSASGCAVYGVRTLLVVGPISSFAFCTSTPLWKTVARAGFSTAPEGAKRLYGERGCGINEEPCFRNSERAENSQEFVKWTKRTKLRAVLAWR